MTYRDYNWTVRQKDDPKVSGDPDHTMFNRRNGYEVLYLINNLMKLWSFQHLREGHKMEQMIRKKLPSHVIEQIDVKDWIFNNWTTQ